MKFAVTGHLGNGVDLPVSWFIVRQALRLEWVKSNDTASAHLDLQVVSSFCTSAAADSSPSSLELAC